MSNSNNLADDKTLLLQAAAQKIRYLTSIEEGPIQEGHVTSSNPSVLATELFGPILIETLSGFLFVVGEDGRLVSVTDNLSQYLGYSPNDWVDQSIYTFLHVRDHAIFSQALLPLAADKQKEVTETNSYRSNLFTVRLRSQCNKETETFDRSSSDYVSMQISSLPQYILTGKLYLVCVAQRMNANLPATGSIPRMSPAFSHQLTSRNLPQHRSSNVSMSYMHGVTNQSGKSYSRCADPPITAPEYFVTQIDKTGIVLQADMTAMGFHDHPVPDFTGKNLLDFAHTNDSTHLNRHLNEVKKGGVGTDHNSSIYRFKLSELRYVFVKTKSRLVKSTRTTEDSNSDEDIIILSRHSIVRECDSSELKGSASSSLMKSLIQSNDLNSTSLIQSHATFGVSHNSIYRSSSLPTHYQVPGSTSSRGSHGHFTQLQSSKTPTSTSENMTLLSGPQSMQYSNAGWELSFHDNQSWKPPDPSPLSSRQRNGSGYSDQCSSSIPQQYQPLPVSTGQQFYQQTNLNSLPNANQNPQFQSFPLAEMLKVPNSRSQSQGGAASGSLNSQGLTVCPDPVMSTSSGQNGRLWELLSSGNRDGVDSSTVTSPTSNFAPAPPLQSPRVTVSQPQSNSSSSGGDEVLKRLLQADDDSEEILNARIRISNSILSPVSVAHPSAMTYPVVTPRSMSSVFSHQTINQITSENGMVSSTAYHPLQSSSSQWASSHSQTTSSYICSPPAASTSMDSLSRLSSVSGPETKVVSVSRTAVASSPASTVTPVVSSNSKASSTVNKGHENNHLLKKLLTGDSKDEDFGDNCKLLHKLLKTGQQSEEAGKSNLSPVSITSVPLSSPKTVPSSPSTATAPKSGPKKRNASSSSTSSGKATPSSSTPKGGKASQNEVKAPKRAYKRQSTTTTEADSSSSTTSGPNSHIIDQLLNRQPDIVQSRGELSDITATPYQKIRSRLGTSGCKQDVVDVVDDKIRHGEQEFNMEKFTQLDPRRPPPQSSFSHQNSLMDSEVFMDQTSYMDMDRTQRTPFLAQKPNMFDAPLAPSFNFNGMGGVQDMFSNLAQTSDSSHLLTQDDDLSVIDSILNGTCDSSTADTTPEDRLAIKDIQLQLQSFEKLPNLSLSPQELSISFTSMPAYASNPSTSNALMNINHRPSFHSMAQPEAYNNNSIQNVTRHRSPGGVAAVLGGISGIPRPRSRISQSPNSRHNSTGNLKIKHLSEGGPPPPAYSSQNSFTNNFPNNFAELMNSANPPPNIELTPELSGHPSAGGSFQGNHPIGSSNGLSNPIGPGGFSNDINMLSPSSSQTQSFPSSPHTMASSSQSQPYHREMHSPQYNNSQQANSHSRVQRQGSASGRYGNPPRDSPFQPNHNMVSPGAMSRTSDNYISPNHSYPNSEQVPSLSPGGVSNHSVSIRQELRAHCVARSQHQSPTHGPSSATQPNGDSTSDGLDMANRELPDDILDQITQLASESQLNNSVTNSHTVSGPHHISTHSLSENRLNQNRHEGELIREQLRALSNSNGVQPNATVNNDRLLDNLFRNQLVRGNEATESHSQSSAPTTGHRHPLNVHKLKTAGSAQIDIIAADPRPPVGAIHSTDYKNSLLQHLLTTD